MQEYYECHVTVQPANKNTMGDKRQIKALVEQANWTFSSIDGDPDFGVGVKCYATFHYHKTTERELIIEKMEALAANLKDNGHKVLRTKIELVVYDNRKY